jgi:hypothetical protein
MSGGLGKRIIVLRKIRMNIEHRDIEIIMMSGMSIDRCKCECLHI